MCCVSNVGLPLVAGLAVAIGAFGFASVQPSDPAQPAGEKPAGGCCQGTATGSENCCGACATGGECAADAAKQPGEDPQPEPGSAHVGELAPDFALIDLEGNRHQLSEYTEAGKIVVLEWFNPECPYVVKHHERFTTMADTYAALTEVEGDEEPGVVWLAINSGREGHPTADHDFNAEAVERWEIAYPVLMDPTGLVGKAYDAKTTPHMFVIAADGTLIYAGAIDNNPSPRVAGDVNYVLQAITQHLAGETITDPETRQYGCGVKY